MVFRLPRPDRAVKHLHQGLCRSSESDAAVKSPYMEWVQEAWAIGLLSERQQFLLQREAVVPRLTSPTPAHRASRIMTIRLKFDE